MKNRVKYIILGILVILFFGLLIGVLNGYLVNFDNAIYKMVTIFKNEGMTKFYKFITFFGSTKFIIGLCVFFLVIFWKNKKGFKIAGCLIGSTILNNVIKLIVRRERPLSLMMVEETTFSFPSGHTMASVSMYGLLIYFVYKSNMNKGLKMLLITLLSLLTIGIALSRIYLGAHYASDVIAAIIVSSIWLIIFIGFFDIKNN